MTLPSRVLATRCPQCHTVFRVVADQLKLRDGLVRCGHCREVFDGRAYLCEPPGDAPETAISEAMHASVAPPTDADDADDADAKAGEVSASDMTAEWPASPASFHTPGAPADVPGTAPAPTVEPTAPTERPPVPEMLTPTAIAALLGTPDESRAQMRHGPGRYIDDDDSTVLSAPTATTPRAQAPAPSGHPAREKHRRVGRMIWRVLLALAVIGALVQWAWIERAALVDRVPASRSLFAVLGRPMHVTIALPRQPDRVQISSVTLVTDAPGATDVATDATADATTDAAAATAGNAASAVTASDAEPMTLTVFIRNQAGYAVAWPSLELTLSDIDGKPVVRRVFAARDYVTDTTQRETGLAPHSERTIRLRLSAQAALASNYRVLAFYP